MTDPNGAERWGVYRGTQELHDGINELPAPPPWRTFQAEQVLTIEPAKETAKEARRASTYLPDANVVDLVNAALYLRRPLLVTGPPGTGKSSSPTRSPTSWARPGAALGDHQPDHTAHGLYQYDPIARLRAAARTPTAGGRGLGPFVRSGRWAPRCCPGSARACCSSTRSTRATSTCPTTC